MKMYSENLAPLAEKQIYILGPLSMQNELLATFLTKTTGAKCVTGKSLEEPLSDGANGCVVLWDCQGKNSKSILAEIQLCPAEKHMVLLFNLGQSGVIEKDAVNKGIRGFLYESESFDKLPRAIQAVCAGELWLSREFMSRWILSTKAAGLSKGDPNGLTSKEMQILNLIGGGASNKDIADNLLISYNTAKTHVYNIFRKINVTNRLQAALWARKNL
jgi:DNA-binding NarL/FixJ family response regulator